MSWTSYLQRLVGGWGEGGHSQLDYYDSHTPSPIFIPVYSSDWNWNQKDIISGPDVPYWMLFGAVRPSWISVQRGMFVYVPCVRRA